MRIDAQWADDAQSIILVTLRGASTWKDMQDNAIRVQGMMNSVNHRVDMISNWGSITSYPDNFLSRARDLTRFRTPNQHLHVIVGGDAFLRELTQLFAEVMGAQGSNYRYAPTLEAAYAMIEQDRNI